jgi:peptidoglycan/xylan/chitin deacetylase (PgdA/CDA1 family)
MGHYAKIGLFMRILVFLFGALCAAQTTAPLTVAPWPGDRAAVISLTFDDAMATHLDIVGPILKKHGLHGTFFVSTGSEAWRKRVGEWQQLAAEGHEIGGHTVKHPCLLERIEPHAQDYTPQMMEAEVRDGAETILREIRGTHGLTFAYTCGNLSFGPPADQARNAALYQRYVAEHFFAARLYGWVGTVAPEELSALTVPDLGFTAGQDFRGLLAMVDPALRNHRWGVFTFHGVGGEWLAVTSGALDELAGYLAAHPEYWTATFGDVVRYIQESQALEIHPGESTGGDGKPLAITAKGTTMLFDVPPKTRSVRIEQK